MKLIGLTGGIGSGKSTIAEIFQTLGIPVFDSDRRAKFLMHSNPKLREEIINLFGREAYSANYELNRAFIASSVFKDPEMLQKLNALVHPAVFEDLVEWVQQPPQAEAPYLLQESAILFEADLASRFSAIILVIAPPDVKISRVIARDGMSKEAIEERMRNQWPDDQKIPFADYIIYNDGIRSLIAQVTDIDRMIRTNG